jgi:hypothetical protein
MRLIRIAVVAAVVVAFVVASALLARGLSAGATERKVLRDIVHAQARGDLPAVLAELDDCPPGSACAARVRTTAARVRRSGDVHVLNIDGATRLALAGGTHVARIAWKTDGTLPVAQCITVRRSGTLLSGFEVRALAVRTIPRENAC